MQWFTKNMSVSDTAKKKKKKLKILDIKISERQKKLKSQVIH